MTGTGNEAGQTDASGDSMEGAVHTPLEEVRAEMEDAITELRSMGREAGARQIERRLAGVDHVVRRLEQRMGRTAAHEYLNTQLAVRHGHQFACCSGWTESGGSDGQEADGE